jgi:hypothetical protein
MYRPLLNQIPGGKLMYCVPAATVTVFAILGSLVLAVALSYRANVPLEVREINTPKSLPPPILIWASALPCL